MIITKTVLVMEKFVVSEIHQFYQKKSILAKRSNGFKEMQSLKSTTRVHL